MCIRKQGHIRYSCEHYRSESILLANKNLPLNKAPNFHEYICQIYELESDSSSSCRSWFIKTYPVLILILTLFTPPALFRESFGATAPPFIDYLKDILRRYPDGGQILKVGMDLNSGYNNYFIYL